MRLHDDPILIMEKAAETIALLTNSAQSKELSPLQCLL